MLLVMHADPMLREPVGPSGRLLRFDKRGKARGVALVGEDSKDRSIRHETRKADANENIMKRDSRDKFNTDGAVGSGPLRFRHDVKELLIKVIRISPRRWRMPLAMQTLDIDDGLSILTEMIVSEIGPRELLAYEEARAAAVVRVERLLQALIAETPSQASLGAQGDDLEGDILFGRTDAEFAFADQRL